MPPATLPLADTPASAPAPFQVSCANGILAADFPQRQNFLSWSLTRPGFVTGCSVAWLEVRNSDLPLGVDPVALLHERMRAAGRLDAIHLMTSRHVTAHHLKLAHAGGVCGACLATVGLGNAGRIGVPPREMPAVAGTINLLAHVDQPLSEAAQIEALSIATEARTAAVMAHGWMHHGHVVTGTGTDCIVIASPLPLPGTESMAARYAGLHTDIGTALGQAIYDAISEGCTQWIAERTSVDCFGATVSSTL